MGFLSEIEELKSNWKKASPIYKVLLCISFFLAVSSIASLSDIIFEWKGFILDGIEFYKQHIVNPIKVCFEKQGIHFQIRAINQLIIIGLIYSSSMRVIWVAAPKKYSSLNSKLFNTANVLVMALMMLNLFLRETRIDNSKQIIPTWVEILMLLVLIYGSRKLSKKEKIQFYGPIILAILTVLILAAVNSGLNK